MWFCLLHPHDFSFIGGYCTYRLQWFQVTLLSTQESYSFPLTGGQSVGLVTFGAGSVSLGSGFVEVQPVLVPPILLMLSSGRPQRARRVP